MISGAAESSAELVDLLNRVPLNEKIGRVTADAAHDVRKRLDAIVERDANAVILPGKNAKLRKPNRPGVKARNEGARFSKYLRKLLWWQLTGYHRQGRVETKMHRMKLLDQRLSAPDYNRQVAEIQICAAIRDSRTVLGMPQTEAMG